MIRKLYVFANCGYYNIPPKSGGQSSARRVAKGIEDIGCAVMDLGGMHQPAHRGFDNAPDAAPEEDGPQKIQFGFHLVILI